MMKRFMLLHHNRDMNVPDIPGSDVRDGLDMSDTQRVDWLLQTEPLHGARPRRMTRERPPLIEDHTGVMDLDAAGGTRGRKAEQHESQAPLLSPERRILMEEEVTTPQGGGGASGSRDSGAAWRGASHVSDVYRSLPT